MTEQLADILTQFVARSGYSSGQLARLSGVPKPTIVNWLEGRVRRPRNVVDLLRLAVVLHLSAAEADRLLVAAGHPSLANLREQANQANDVVLQEWVNKWDTAVSPPHFNLTPPFQVTADLPYFVGREDSLQKLRRHLTAPIHKQPYSIQGMPGVGKTALAVHLAYQLRDAFPDGVLWARVDTSEPMAILRTFAHAYGVDVSHYSDLASRSRVVRELLANKRALIILDNVENSEQVKPLLPPTGPCAVLITTRRHDLSVLRGAYRLVLRPFSPHSESSLLLFRQILGNDRVEHERALFSEMAELLGHLPLAIDIAASRLAYEPGWTTAAFLQRLRAEQRQLSELAYEDQSVRLSFNASYEMLSEAEQQFFTALGAFAGEDFSIEAAAVVADLSLVDAEDKLRRLYGLSLLRYGRSASNAPISSRYGFHPLLRAFARERLPHDSPVWLRLIKYYVKFLEHPHDFGILDMEVGNILGALEVAWQKEQTAEFLQGVNGIYRFLEARGMYETAGDLLARAETAVTPETNPATRLLLYLNTGHLAQKQGEYIEAETRYETALTIAREINDRPNLSHILRALGVLAARRGDYVLADAYYTEGLTLARELGHGGIVSNFLRGLGVQAWMRGDFARAEAFYEEGLALMHVDDAESTVGTGGMMWGLGVLAQEQGDLPLAERYYREALAQARNAGHQERIVVLLRSLAALAMAQGELETAETHWQEALKLARALGHRWQIARVLSELGELFLQQQEIKAANAAFRELYELARMMQSQELVASAQFGLARVAAHQGDLPRALQYGRESLDSYTAIGHFRVNEVKAWFRSLHVA
ncbi:MAG: hypothetical protein D6706_08040 [Chloroflexi bacterium]|nr:MAG: hypothetical protein D6706_08040 [Chloroflexota bacterium]